MSEGANVNIMHRESNSIALQFGFERSEWVLNGDGGEDGLLF